MANILFFFQSIIYLFNVQYIKLIRFNSSKKIIEDEIVINKFQFEGNDFYYPANNKKKYNTESFNSLKKLLNNVLKKKKPSVFIDIGAYIGLYSFLIKKIYFDKKNIKFFSFDPTTFAFDLLNKNSNFENHKIFKLGVYNQNKTVNISAPNIYYTNHLTNAVNENINSMKSFNEEGGIETEEVKLTKLLEVLDPSEIEKSHIKIDVEGSEFEVLDYLNKNNLNPLSLSIELNNHYLYKRFLTLEKIICKKFIKNYNLCIVDEENFNLKNIDMKILKENVIYGKNKNFLKKYFMPKVNAFDLYLFKKI